MLSAMPVLAPALVSLPPVLPCPCACLPCPPTHHLPTTCPPFADSVKKVFNQTASALAAITVLKKVCDHPALLSERAAHGIVSGASRARRQAAARLGGGGSGSSSDVEEIEGSSEEEDSEDEGVWESGGPGGGWCCF